MHCQRNSVTQARPACGRGETSESTNMHSNKFGSCQVVNYLIGSKTIAPTGDGKGDSAMTILGKRRNAWKAADDGDVLQ